MKRVILLGVTMAFAFGCLVGGGVKAVKAETIELKMAHFMPPMHIQHQKSFVPFAQNVEKLSGGKVKIKIYSGGALGGPKQLADAVKTGITDIAFIIPSYTTGRFPRTSVFDLPFLFDNAVHATNGIYDLYDKYLAEDYKDYKVLWLYSFGAGQLHSVTKPIHTIDDLKGMKIRSGTAYMSKALELLGANPVGMPVSKLSISLQKKVIDGVLTPYCAAVDFKLLDLLKYITQADVYVSPMAVVMNKEKFDSLPEFAQKAINEASGKKWGLHAAQVYDRHDKDAVSQMEEQGKIKIYRLPDSEKLKFVNVLNPLKEDWVKDMSEKGLPAREMLDVVHIAAEKNK